MESFLKLFTMPNKLYLVLIFCLSSTLSGIVNAEEDYKKLDTFESVNRVIFDFNDQADQYLLKPVAQAYRYITPSIVDKGVSNFFNNLDDVETFANSLLQAKFHNAIVTLNRIIYNTTFGLGGFFDVATSFGLINDSEDFGQTLGYWGYENSTYLMLPFLGPSTVRDLSGRIVDRTFEPLQYVEDVHDDTIYLSTGVKIVDKRADLLSAENLILGGDRYDFIRSAYYQNRNFLINDGDVSDPFADEDYEYYEDF